MEFTAQAISDAYEGGIISLGAYQWALMNLDYLNRPMKLFGSSQKVEKGAEKRETYVLYMQPADKVAVRTLCPVAEVAGCKGPCLIDSGQLGMKAGQRAATKRTLWFLLDREGFEYQLYIEMQKAFVRFEKGRTERPLFRLNGTSDIDWTAFIERHQWADFYDYTKVPAIVRKARNLLNYDVTYSGSMYSAQSRTLAEQAIVRGDRVAFAVNSKGLKSDCGGLNAILEDYYSFDETDLRPLDDAGIIGVLSRKGSNKADRAAENERSESFFVTGANVWDWLLMTHRARLARDSAA